MERIYGFKLSKISVTTNQANNASPNYRKH